MFIIICSKTKDIVKGKEAIQYFVIKSLTKNKQEPSLP